MSIVQFLIVLVLLYEQRFVPLRSRGLIRPGEPIARRRLMTMLQMH